MVRVVMILLMAAILAIIMPVFAQGFNIHQLRQMVAKTNSSCLLVFGDSSVDPGNNNHLPLAPKSNFPPYGKDLFTGRRPTGRFTNGRLATDFIAEAFGYVNVIQAFLDPTIKEEALLHGVSFASAGSGYDELTTNLSKALPIWKQMEYFRHYKIHLSREVGEMKAEEIIRNAILIVSMGTNDFLQNYYIDPTRSQHFTVKQYQNYLISRMLRFVKTMHEMGARRVAIVGVPPFGCMPIVKTLKDESKCDDEYNKVAFSFNSKIKQKLAVLNASLAMQTAYIDIYRVIASAIHSPKKYGFEETSKGCCGSGLIEFGDTCKGMSTCADPTKYVFWDAIHPTQKMYEFIAIEALKSLAASMN
ncbi:GDSL esterase/lipase At5g45950 [Diospyros lotus]|uniref:GDSL esterase/lipase At5g45950 n=1 Tax=Diospyros lotus TaxID=55363 RepID=UPI0022509369|nr:GDSL esterase/lipase At5g45950 [Diospyros lotus]